MTIRTSPDDSDYLAPHEASHITSLSTRTLARMADKGQISGYTLPTGHRRYLRADIERLIHSVRRDHPDGMKLHESAA